MNSQDVDDGRDREAEERQAMVLELAFRRFGELAAIVEQTEMVRVEDRRTTDIGCLYARWAYWDAMEGRTRHHELMYAVAPRFLTYWRVYERCVGEDPEAINDPRLRWRHALEVLYLYYERECERLEHLLAQEAGEWRVEPTE